MTTYSRHRFDDDNRRDDGPLCLYMIVNSTPKAKKNSYLGCSRDPYTRLDHHNSTDPAIVSVAVDRRAQNNAPWTPVMIIVLPRDRNLSGLALKRHWNRTRTPTGRFRQGVAMAAAMGLPYYVNADALRHDANFSDSSFADVLQLCADDGDLHRIESPTSGAGSKVDGIDFDKGTDPMQFFRKKPRVKLAVATVVLVTSVGDLLGEVLN